ncbi:GntR family transcriptional regulator [Salinicoccus albus]|uniref:GntR family transcriptional regulator n=1 Tax=Salinicoccus albus TaxID=418756 RepID=UPI00035D3EBD|nr:GntR family transcriptional regulator [Salinicoccus albus]
MTEIKSSLLVEQAYDILRKKILNRVYMPGEKLNIYDLSDEFQISRSPIKEAINQLEYEGLIEIVPRKGTYVTEVKLETFLEKLDARLMVELWAARKVIHTISASKIREWGQVIRQMDDLLDIDPFPFQKYNSLDMQFHAALIDWEGSTTLKAFYSSLNTHVALARIVQSTSFESTIKRHRDHWELYDAMENRNLEAFSTVLDKHIESMKQEATILYENTYG